MIKSIFLGIFILLLPFWSYADDVSGFLPDPANDRITDDAAISNVGDPNNPNFVGPPSSASPNNILGIPNNQLRTGNVDMNTIPAAIVHMTNLALGVAGTIAIVALIYYAIQMQINSGITGDSSGVDKAKRGMIGALVGFVIAILAWFIILQSIRILSSIS